MKNDNDLEKLTLVQVYKEYKDVFIRLNTPTPRAPLGVWLTSLAYRGLASCSETEFHPKMR